MPLNIIGYSEMRLHPKGSLDIAHLADQEADFPGRAVGLQDGRYGFTDSWGFAIGGGSYGMWRHCLAVLAGYPSDTAVWENPTPGPFVELIDFTDNTGWIGPEVAAKLAKDFADHATKAPTMGPEFDEIYRNWLKVMDLAAKKGAVEFA